MCQTGRASTEGGGGGGGGQAVSGNIFNINSINQIYWTVTDLKAET